MMHYTKRCIHCKSTYQYQASGNGCHDPINDDTYCPGCKGFILESLKNVPKKFDQKWVETDEVTYDYLLEKRKIQDIKNSGLCTRRVYFSLRNIVTGESEKNDAFDVDDKQYLVQYWPSKKEDIKVKVLMEKNLITGETKNYWKDYR